MLPNAHVMELQLLEREFRMECARIVRLGVLAIRTPQSVLSAQKVRLPVGLGAEAVHHAQGERSLRKKARRLASAVPGGRYQRQLQDLRNVFQCLEEKS